MPQIVVTLTGQLMIQVYWRCFFKCRRMNSPDFQQRLGVIAVTHAVDLHRIVIIDAHQFSWQYLHYCCFEMGKGVSKANDSGIMSRHMRRILHQFAKTVALWSAEGIAPSDSTWLIQAERKCLDDIIDKDRLEFRMG